MKSDIQSYRQSSWAVEQCQLMPWLVVLKPYGSEGSQEIVVGDRPLLFYVDHGWEDTFGYAFGEVHGIGREAAQRLPDINIGDFVHITRCAYATATDRQGELWLFVNWRDCLAKIFAEEKQQDSTPHAAHVTEEGAEVDAKSVSRGNEGTPPLLGGADDPRNPRFWRGGAW
jgi:hypothetical protein